jgi:hypothetical protein
MEIIFFENFSPAFFNNLREPLIVQKQTISRQKAPDFSFNLAPWKWAWYYQEGATLARREKYTDAWGKKSYFRTGGRDSLMILPCQLSGCQIKAEIKGFFLVYCLFQYYQWFFHNFEVSKILEMTCAPCIIKRF